MTSPSQDRLFGTNSSMAIKVPCRVATTANITLSGEQTIDGVAVVANDRVLVKNQTTPSQNGIYFCSTSTWQRTPDFDGTRDVTQGTIIKVNSGASGMGFWYLSTTGTIVVGTTSLSFVQGATDSATSTFIQAGTGAVLRTAQLKMREIVSVKDFGAAGTGLSDDTTAIQAAIDYAESLAAASPNTGAAVYFPAGSYLVSATLTIQDDNITLHGDGRDLSIISRNAAYAHTLDIDNGAILQNIRIEGLSFYHDIGPGNVMSGAHIRADAVTYLTIRDVRITHGAYGVILLGCVYAKIENAHLYGDYVAATPSKNGTTALYLQKTSNAGAVEIPTIVNISECQVNGAGVAASWQYGCVINAGEEVHFTNCTFNAGPVTNMLLQQLSDNKAIYEITFTNCFFDASMQRSVWIDGSAGNGTQNISRVRFVGCGFNGEAFTPPSGPGIGLFVDGTARGGTYSQVLHGMEIIGCSFQGQYAEGVVLNGGVDITISGSTWKDNNISNAAGKDNLVIGAAVSNITVTGNNIGGTTGTGTGLAKYGISIANGATNVTIVGNNLSRNTTGALSDLMSATSKKIFGNIGVTDTASNSLGADVNLNNTGNYFDGPSVSLGAGTWLLSGTVTVRDTAGAADFAAKLWDGSTVAASAESVTGSSSQHNTIALSAVVSPTATTTYKISVKDTTSTSGLIKFNASGESKDSTLTAVRIA